MRVRGFAVTDEAGSRSHEFEVGPVPVAPHLGNAEHALVDATGAGSSRMDPIPTGQPRSGLLPKPGQGPPESASCVDALASAASGKERTWMRQSGTCNISVTADIRLITGPRPRANDATPSAPLHERAVAVHPTG
jgi:hypothetical protein